MNIHDFTVTGMHGKPFCLSAYAGTVLLIVNTATHCGFTAQYEMLQSLYSDYHAQGFEILDFPCNQFKEQAPGSIEEIDAFCTLTYKTTFPRFAKLEVNGPKQDPLYAYLKQQKGFAGFDPNHEKTAGLERRLRQTDAEYEKDPSIKWNFTKFLVDRHGDVVARFEPTATRIVIEERMKTLL
ncbi:glutathione peroxidase [Sphaerochaeta sp.]|uniref:glutathione peroxidase n=1 Tax=Sphaerochaeta sp. TaxID=1972642 RepID=UPI002FCBCF9B